MNLISKKEGRLKSKQMRESLSPKYLHEGSEKICDLLFSNFNLAGKKISLFLPMESKKEVDTYIILEKALSLNSFIGVPKANFDTCQLKHYIYSGPTQLEISSYGIPEPKRGRIMKPEAFDFVIVPLVGFDKKGYRIGYGKGFYDRFLAKCDSQTQFIGLSLFDPFDEITDVDVNDIRMHVCITPNAIFRF